MKKIIEYLVLASALALLMASPAFAADPLSVEPKVGTRVVLDEHTEAVYQGKNAEDEHIYTATISSLPVYTNNLKTKISPSWQFKDGQWVAGANLFGATVDAYGTKVTITKDKEYMILDPVIKINNVAIKPVSQAPQIVPDYYNPNYTNNTLEWDYGSFKRQIRLIEGCIFQYLIFDSNPNGTVNIDSPLKSLGFKWSREDEAWDANGNPILVADNLVYASELDKASYPIVIDPSPSFYTSASDGYLWKDGVTWASARTAGTADFIYKTSTYMQVTAATDAEGEDTVINRSYVYFDTDSIPDGATLTDAKLYLYLYQSVSDDWNASTYIVSGMSTYPHDPLVTTDYNYSYYSFGTNYGYRAVTTMSVGYNQVNTNNSTALKGIINKSGTTKLALVDGCDRSGTNPYGSNQTRYYTYEKGSGYRPYITVTYSTTAPGITAEAASNISYTSARLNSTVNDDGGEACDVRFGYGKVSQAAVDFESYTVKTDWVEDTYVTGNHPYYDAGGLDSNDTYYYRAQIRNSDSTVTSTNEITFDTLNDILDVTDLRAYPSVTSVSLNWTKPSGATNTMVRYALDDYPATVADGEQIYFGAGNNCEHAGVTGGTTYYYSAWGESGGSYSTSADEVAITTFPVGTPSDEIPEASMPTGWYQSPDYTNLSNLGIFYIAVNNLADDISMPRATAWIVLVILLAAGAAFLLYWRTHNTFAAIGGAGVVLVIGYFQELVSLWMMIIPIVIGIGIIASRRSATA